MKIHLNSQNIVNMILLIGSLIYLYFSFQLPGEGRAGPSFLPILAGFLLFICSIVLLIQNINNKKKSEGDSEENYPIIQVEKRHFILILFLFLYLIALPYFTFIPSTIIFMFLIGLLYGFKGIVKPLILSITITLVVYYIFQILLKVPLDLI